MSWYDRIFSRPMGLADFAQAAPVQLSLESPNQTSSLAKVIFSDYYGGELGEVTREGALQVPAIKKARALLIGSIAGTPLRQYTEGVESPAPWLHNTKSGISPWHRAAYTLDDLLFYDWSAWAVERDSSGQITDAVRIPFDRWTTNDRGVVYVDSRPVSAEQIILIPGSGDGGILACGAPTIKGYKAVERAWVGRAQNPIPLVELHQTSDDPLTDGSEEDEEDEINTLISDWSAARTSPTGAVGYTPHNVEVRVHGSVSTDLFEEGRNAAVLDVARLTGVPASLLDGAQSQASLTYVTSEGKRSEFDALSLPQWIDPIEARLSLDDVSPAGSVIRFDKSSRVATVPDPVREPLED